MTKLVYLGEHSNLSAAEDAYRLQSAEFAFAWTWIQYKNVRPHGPTGEPSKPPGTYLGRAMAAWIPGLDGRHEFGLWPVYGGTETRLDLDATQWGWDGNLEAPTLTPSIHGILYPNVPAQSKTIYHGFIQRGHWNPC